MNGNTQRRGTLEDSRAGAAMEGMLTGLGIVCVFTVPSALLVYLVTDLAMGSLIRCLFEV